MGNLKGRDLLSLADLQPQEIQDLLTLAQQLKSGAVQFDFQRKTLGLLFRKASYRDWETDRKSTRLNSSHRL